MDRRLSFRSGAGLSFLDWVAIYNNGKPVIFIEGSPNTRTKSEVKNVNG